MSNLICKDCKGTDVTEYPPGIFGDPRHRCNSCGKISNTSDFVELTVFDRIAASPEVLAEEFVGMMYDRVSGEYKYYSMFTGEFYNSYEDAISETLEKLNEVEKGVR